ncbi:MAG: putative signaling protein, partial [Frankiales bacterium]|nr:putative signaling protein [Frankiales bacterium]
CSLLERSPGALVGRRILDLPEFGGARATLSDLLSGLVTPEPVEVRLAVSSGRHVTVAISLSALDDASGARAFALMRVLDMTGLRSQQRVAHDAETCWRSLSQTAGDVALVTDAQLVVAYASPRFWALVGLADAPKPSTSLLDLVHRDDRDRVEAATHHFVANGGTEFAMEFRIAGSGGWRHVAARTVNLLSDVRAPGLVMTLRDETERQRLQVTAQRDVLHDRLTGLPNRHLLMDRVQQALERQLSTGAPYALLVLNVDGLRAINNNFGHAAGDEVLRMTADTLAALVRPADTVARYDGDRFAVLIDNAADHVEVTALAERVAACLVTDLRLPGEVVVHVSACVGVAHGPTRSADALLSSAEAATYRAKALGRGRVHVLEHDAQEQLHVQRILAAELEAAIRDEQLAVFFQPVVQLDSGRIVGFEALARWPHADRGMIPPDVFLPLAASLDLLGQLDRWVLDRACRTAVTWPPNGGRGISVAVNVSSGNLMSPGFAENVQRALAASGLPATSLVLEVTETAVVTDVDAAGQALRALSEIGVSVSIDDFGTGYSSLLQLRQLPFDSLKIDREFVRGLPDNRDDIAICASALALARRTGLRTVAEGVETVDQAAALVRLGCEFGQGFLWSPAVSADAALELLKTPEWPPSAAARELPLPSARGLTDDPSVVATVRAIHETGASLSTIAARLNGMGLRTSSGRRWHTATVARLLYDSAAPITATGDGPAPGAAAR